MSLYEKIKLLDLLKDGTVRSYCAFDPGSKRTVLLHWLPSAPGPERDSLFAFLDALPPAGRALILEAGIAEGRPYLITENPQTFTDLRDWLKQAAVQKSQGVNDRLEQKGIWKIPSRQPQAESLRVTKTIEYSVPQLDQAPVQQAPSCHARDPMKPVEPSPTSEPGEFTRMFLASTPRAAGQSVQPEPVKPQITPPPLQPSTVPPGEFTSLFNAPRDQRPRGAGD